MYRMLIGLYRLTSTRKDSMIREKARQKRLAELKNRTIIRTITHEKMQNVEAGYGTMRTSIFDN